MRVFKNGAPAGTAADIDLREGTGISLTVSDESGANGATAVTIANSGSIASVGAFPAVVHPAGLRRWRAAMGKALTGVGGRPVVNFYGHSITAGAKAQDTISSTPDAKWASLGYVTQTRQLLAALFGDPGEGYIRLADDPRVVLAGGPTATSSYGPFTTGVAVKSTGTITITTPQCTQIDFIYWWDNSNTQTFTYTIDGGSAVTSTTRNATSTFYKDSATGLADTTHTVVITGTSATVAAAISAVACYRNTTGGGVVVNRIAKSGATSNDLVGAALSQVSQDVLQRATQLIVPPDLAVFDIGTNDYLAQVPTPTVFKSNVKKFTDYQVNTNGGCCLLVSGSRRDNAVAPGPNATYPQETYFQQLQDLANENDHIAYIDLSTVWGQYADANALGLLVDTSVHPGSKGHGDIARMMHRVLTGSFPYTA